MVILLQQIISGRQVKKSYIFDCYIENLLICLGKSTTTLSDSNRWYLSVPYQTDPFYNRLHFSTEGPFVLHTQQVKPSVKTKKVIRVLEISLLFKKQDYNHYYLDILASSSNMRDSVIIVHSVGFYSILAPILFKLYNIVSDLVD